MQAAHNLILISNRLPATVESTPDGLQIKPSSGGLVTALRPVLASQKGAWIGSIDANSGMAEALLELSAGGAHPDDTCDMIGIPLTRAEQHGFYAGFSNEIVWPLFHDLQSRCNFDPAYWNIYASVNRKFAATIAQTAQSGSRIWVHDYHLMLTGKFLREMGLCHRMGFFLHIPFPPLDIFEKLPWRCQILEALFQFNVIGFQTARDQRNFVGCVRRLLPKMELQRVDDEVYSSDGEQASLIRVFPIGIDYNEFARAAEQPAVLQRVEKVRRDMHGQQIVLGVDRLDYTKGIPDRLKAFRHLLQTHSQVHRKISLVQIVVPSREHIPEYRELKQEIETLISQINGTFSDSGWTPVHYIHRSLSRTELLALYRAADIALITPLKDGMNLVAKEFCAAQIECRGLLILSEFAGAAAQLRGGAILVNPYDIEAVAEAVLRAYETGPKERRKRMLQLRRNVRKADVYHWCDDFCACLDGAGAA